MTAIIELSNDALVRLVGDAKAKAIVALARAYEPEDLNVQPRTPAFWELHLQVCQALTDRPDAWLKITELAVSAVQERNDHTPES